MAARARLVSTGAGLVGAHATRVRSGIALTDPFVVLRRGERTRRSRRRRARKGSLPHPRGILRSPSGHLPQPRSPLQLRSSHRDGDAFSCGKPSALITTGIAEPVERRAGVGRCLGALVIGSRNSVRAAQVLGETLRPSSWAAAALGPKTAMPPAKRSATPATSGASGPTTTRSMPSRFADRTTACDRRGRSRRIQPNGRSPGCPAQQ